MLLKSLAADLTSRFGRGFGLSNLKQIRRFYLLYEDRPKSRTVSGLLESDMMSIGQTASGLLNIPEIAVLFRLSWSHYATLSISEDRAKRDYYNEHVSQLSAGGGNGRR